jgi:hypothetical protein
MTFSTPTIHRFPGITTFSFLFVLLEHRTLE